MSENSSTYNSGVQLYDYNNLPIYPRVNVENISFNEYDPNSSLSEFINIHIASCDKIELLNNIDINNDTNGLHINAVDADKKISSNMRLAYVNSENETIEYALKNDIEEVDLSQIESSINSLDASVKTLDASVNSINDKFDDYYTQSEIDAKNYASKTYVNEEIAKIDVGGDIPDDVVTRDELNAYATKAYVDGSINALNDSIDTKVANIIGNEYATKSEVSTGLSTKVNTGDYNTKITNIDNSIKSINSSVNDISTKLANKVDKVEGKGLSTNDFTNDLKTKLEGIQDKAEVNYIKAVDTSNSILTYNPSTRTLGAVDLPGYANTLVYDKPEGADASSVIIPVESSALTVTFKTKSGGNVTIQSDISGTVESAKTIDVSNISAVTTQKYLPLFVEWKNVANGKYPVYKSNYDTKNNNIDGSLYLSFNDGSNTADNKWYLHTPNITCHGSLDVSGNTHIKGVTTIDGSAYINDVKIENGDITANEFYKSSDERLKNFSNDISIDFDALRNIPKKYFTWKSDELNKQHIGTSAQEIQKIYPELVKRDENDMLSVDYSTLSIVALKAIDILVDRIEKLENELYGR